ncbi:hypothetical protein AWM75_05630 [Aerococcus urinaehominis]|uniref:Uncharacterized protein n=1 Tax=Aerococcus urinaehominis TaxID=128944 RepID=A0A0X8FLN2_9LACT|nr:GNAT family N-acetyltransferase [Aerococcus urinaehominis]AMB99507.1 hypothetical protein AWM75_05630 [Aerococcus urinaehominis]SDM26043.1 hypothetical protein SAMN04487985_11017 [Aerococcus urinaehominis]
MIKIQEASQATDINYLEDLYYASFPPVEQIVFDKLLDLSNQNKLDLLYLEQDGEYAGLAFCSAQDDYVLLNYFAVDAKQRGGGLGSHALAALKTYYPDKIMFLESEFPHSHAANHQMRRRRLGFYERNGFSAQDYIIHMDGEDYVIFCQDGETISSDAYLEFWKNYMGSEALDNTYVAENLSLEKN